MCKYELRREITQYGAYILYFSFGDFLASNHNVSLSVAVVFFAGFKLGQALVKAESIK